MSPIFKQHYFAFVLVAMLLFSTVAKSASIKGFVLDSKNKEGLIGATVFNKDNIKISDIAALNGTYLLKNISPGTYTIKAQYIGYIAQEKTITIKENNESVRLDFFMEADAVQLNAAVVEASVDKQSDSYSRDLEKNSNNIMNVMSAKTI